MYVYLSSIFILGLIIGSFISALTYRIPKNIGFVKSRSFCDSCKTKLNWYDNIPLFSYLYYLGKSRCCNKKISIRYPLIELASALGIILLSPIYYVLYLLCLSIFVIDIEHQIIPDELSWLVLLLALFTVHGSLFTSLFSGFFFSLLLLTLYLVTKGRGMGLGDVKLAIPLGLLLGLERGIYWLMTSFIIGGIVASILLLLKRANLKTKIAFGPFLIFAFWIVLLTI
ncbi:MAG: prepilin peptidase [Candidatus Woesebacteria bacterium]|nr:prepilin peptidase [Candidatus Woesebacteria bacterium]